MAELHWPRGSQFRDPARGFTFTGPGTTEVPDDAVDRYLERGWEQPDEDAAPPVATQETEADADADEADADGFDAEAFVDDSWQSITSRIEDGEADGHLDAVREAEASRDGEPRSSVIEAIEARQG